MIAIRRAVLSDAPGMALVHVASWRATYAGILPESSLLGLSPVSLARSYLAGLRAGTRAHVAVASGSETGLAPCASATVIGFVTARKRDPHAALTPLADGEIETLYVLDDFRDRGFGRDLLRAAAADLAAAGCASLLVWVLSENPSRWFYAHMGGRHAVDGTVMVGGEIMARTGYIWDRLDALV
jgi:ribosomal protein S18 acetylase RimI-like enzyme